MKFHVSIICETEEMVSICYQKPLQTLGRHGPERHTGLCLTMLLNSAYQNNLYIIALQIDSIKCRSNYLPANMQYYTRSTCLLRINIYYKSFTYKYNFTTQQWLLKRKLKIYKRVSTAYILNTSTNSWGYLPTCL
jgi:hypothetical protein